MPEEPLVPRSASGVGLAAILLAAFTGALGFLGQKALDFDEKLVALQEQQKDDEIVDLLVQEMKERIANIESEQKNRLKVIDLVVRLDERTNRIEAHLTDLTKEVDRLRDTK